MASMGHANLARLLVELKRYDEARQLYARALKNLESMDGPQVVVREGARMGYAEVLLVLGERAAARAEGERAVRTIEALVPADDGGLAAARKALAKLQAG
jgi:tetratricopeptide (TPR) repeat protein